MNLLAKQDPGETDPLPPPRHQALGVWKRVQACSGFWFLSCFRQFSSAHTEDQGPDPRKSLTATGIKKNASYIIKVGLSHTRNGI